MEIKGLGKAEITIVWDDEGDDAAADVWSARDLRLHCSCAHCVHELSGEKLLDPATVPADVTVKSMSLVGNYGVSIEFSDGHSTGIYRFDALWDAKRPAHQ